MKKVRAGEYQPKPALEFAVPKPAGGTRLINVFTIPDSALSNLVARNLISRNTKLFSSSSYAYQNDKTQLDAIIKASNYIKSPKVFILQYDFKSYFDSISHKYIKSLIGREDLFLTTHSERSVLHAFLNHRHARADKYKANDFHSRDMGIPQGCSISLFLANVAAHELDIELDRQNGCFVRYADDSVVMNYSYEDAIKTIQVFHNHSIRSGVSINHSKSVGVRIFRTNPQESECEIRHVDSFSFLGYEFRNGNIRLSEKATRRIKARISTTIYRHLLLYPKRAKAVNSARFGAGFRDWDLVTCINEVSRYIYGGIKRKDIEGFLEDRNSLGPQKGLFGYFCLVNDHEQLHGLDGWIADALARAYAERVRILSALGIPLTAPNRMEWLDGSWYDFPKIPMDLRAPSIFLAWRAARKRWARHGVKGIRMPETIYLY